MKPIKETYQEDVVPALLKEFEYSNVMQVPRIKKVVLNIGLGEALDNARAVEFAVRDIEKITGQKPVLNKAKKSIAGFKLREGRIIGVKVTLRGEKMWAFLQRLIHVALPRTRDFQGVSADAFDGRGNYTLGLPEQLIFPEISYDSIDKVRGLSVSIVTSARNDEEGRRLLALLEMPFVREMA
ncbi:MAG: 50S ribosomal protein L5 [Ardenticatenaceae bacterium]|nr:50S ribosomal protein L5 [Ardenticatenaceae bacterium]